MRLWSQDQGAVFLPVDVPILEGAPTEAAPVAPVVVELRLAKGRCLRFDSAIDDAVLSRLIRAVEAA